MEIQKPLIILTGPTAAGKTEISIQLAKAVGGEIISADSMQVYRHMDIGTAKIKPQEMQGVKHFLIDCLEPEEEFNVVAFQRMAKAAMAQIYENGHIPIIVGGTGFYIQSVLYDIDFGEATGEEEDLTSPWTAQDEYRLQLYSLAEEKGADYLHAMLAAVDAVSAQQIHKNNIKRVVRALEYFHQTGEQISVHNAMQRSKTSPYNFLYFVLNDKREILYERINRRVDQMFEQGLEAELKWLLEQGYDRKMVSMQGIGYKEMFGYFDGEYDLDRAKYLIKQNTRHFAKRQITWFKREKNVTWMEYGDYHNSKEEIVRAMIQMAKEWKLV